MFSKRKEVSMFNLKTNFTRNPRVICTVLPDGGGLLLNSDSKYFYTLNETALKIWNLIDGKKNASDIVKVLLKEYDVISPELTQSVFCQIKEFSKHGLLKTK